MEAEVNVEAVNKVSFSVQYPNNVYVTMRNLDTEVTEVKPFTISYSHKEGLPFVSVWKRPVPVAMPSNVGATATVRSTATAKSEEPATPPTD